MQYALRPRGSMLVLVGLIEALPLGCKQEELQASQFSHGTSQSRSIPGQIDDQSMFSALTVEDNGRASELLRRYVSRDNDIDCGRAQRDVRDEGPSVWNDQ